MYNLTLTMDERRAFTWVGSRYPTGSSWVDVLLSCGAYGGHTGIEPEKWEDENPNNWWWEDCPYDITFHIPENKAWELVELASNQNGIEYPTFPCFGGELESKLVSFCERIV